VGLGGINDLTAATDDGAPELEKRHIILRTAFWADDRHTN
jgi:hypothetical protein